MSFYSWAFNDLDDPYWACVYAVETHPLYHQCDKCPSFLKCTQPVKFIMPSGLPVSDEPPRKYQPPPAPTEPLPYQDVTGDQLFTMLLQRIKQFFTRFLPKNNPIPSKRRRE